MEDKYDYIINSFEIMDMLNKEDQYEGLSGYIMVKGNKKNGMNWYYNWMIRVNHGRNSHRC